MWLPHANRRPHTLSSPPFCLVPNCCWNFPRSTASSARQTSRRARARTARSRGACAITPSTFTAFQGLRAAHNPCGIMSFLNSLAPLMSTLPYYTDGSRRARSARSTIASGTFKRCDSVTACCALHENRHAIVLFDLFVLPFIFALHSVPNFTVWPLNDSFTRPSRALALANRFSHLPPTHTRHVHTKIIFALLPVTFRIVYRRNSILAFAAGRTRIFL